MAEKIGLRMVLKEIVDEISVVTETLHRQQLHHELILSQPSS